MNEGFWKAILLIAFVIFIISMFSLLFSSSIELEEQIEKNSFNCSISHKNFFRYCAKYYSSPFEKCKELLKVHEYVCGDYT